MRAYVLAAVALAALAGCGGSPAPRPADVQACTALYNYGPNVLYGLQHPGADNSTLAAEAQKLADGIKTDGQYSAKLAPRAMLVGSEALLITTELDPAIPDSIPLDDAAKFADYQAGMSKVCRELGAPAHP